VRNFEAIKLKTFLFLSLIFEPLSQVDVPLMLSVSLSFVCRQERHGMKEPNQFDDIVSAVH
jgi:hypothetical protein